MTRNIGIFSICFGIFDSSLDDFIAGGSACVGIKTPLFQIHDQPREIGPMATATPIHYNEPVYRPPSEAESLIFQVTLGCSHNRCAFCTMYRGKRFKVRAEEDVLSEIRWASQQYPGERRIFLADGDAMALQTPRLERILLALREAFPRLERVSAYASPQNLLHKTPEDLALLKKAGLSLVYFGLESGDDEILKKIDKGASSAQMIEACAKAQSAGLDLSVTVVLGLWAMLGLEQSQSGASATGRTLAAIRPRYASALTYIGEESKSPLRPIDVLTECQEMLTSLDLRDEGRAVTFRSNHASNYLSLKGELPHDREALLEKIAAVIDQVKNDPHSPLLRPEWGRGL